jgi:hypothetical protein
MKTTDFRLMLSVFGFSAASFLSGCASLQSVSVTSIPRDRTHVVSADEDNVAFLGIHFSNAFADPLRDRLKEQCPHGKVTGIYTKYETVWYFIVQKRQVTATGYCVEGETPANAAPQAKNDAREGEAS